MVSASKQGKNNKASHKPVLKWEIEFNTKIDCDLEGKDVVRLRCTLSEKWERGTYSLKNFTYNHTRPGYTSIERDSINSYCLSEPHKEAAKLEMKSKSGATTYMESVIRNTPIGRAIKIMCNENRNICSVLSSSAYYLAKQERPFSDFSNLLKLQEKNKNSQH